VPFLIDLEKIPPALLYSYPGFKTSFIRTFSITKYVVYSRAAPKGAKSYLILNVSIGGPAIGRALLLRTE